jgi:hypothetical protein
VLPTVGTLHAHPKMHGEDPASSTRKLQPRFCQAGRNHYMHAKNACRVSALKFDSYVMLVATSCATTKPDRRSTTHITSPSRYSTLLLYTNVSHSQN